MMSEMTGSPNAGASPLASNVMFAATGTLISNVCLYLSNWAIIRYYRPDLHGTTAWLVGVAILSMLLTDLGLASKGSVRRIARARAGEGDLNEAISALITIPTLLALAAAGGVALAIGSTAGERVGVSGPVAALTAVWVVCMAGERAGRTLAIGLQQMRWTLMMRPVAELAKLIWVGVCWATGLDFKWLLIGWTVAYALSATLAIVSAIALSRQFGFHLRIRLLSLGKTLATIGGALPYYLPQLWLVGVPMALRLAVGSYWPAETISVFQVFWSLAAISRLVSLPIGLATFPRIAQADRSGAGHLGTGQVLRSSARMLGLVSSAQLALLWVFGCWLLPAVYGAKAGQVYVGHMPALLVFIVALGIENVAILLDQVLMAISARLLAGIELGKIALMALAVWGAVPTYGVFGAACAYLGVIVGATSINALTAMLVTFAATAVAGTWLGFWWAILAASLVAAVACRLLRLGDLRLWMQTGWRVVASRCGKSSASQS